MSYANSCLKVTVDTEAPREELEKKFHPPTITTISYLITDQLAFLTTIAALLLVFVVRGFRPFRPRVIY